LTSGVREDRFRENTHLLIVFDDKNGCHLSFSPCVNGTASNATRACRMSTSK
jgi:hypothetical protein